MRRLGSLLALALSLGAGVARADDGGPAVRVGFFRGADFQNGATRTHLEGFEVGADVPLARPNRSTLGIYFSPTVTFGGSNRHGADTDGSIYHLLITGRYGFAQSGVYAALGLGYGFTQAKNNEFRNVSGFAAGYTLGYSPQGGRRVEPLVEVTYHDGAHSQLRGLSVDVGARF